MSVDRIAAPSPSRWSSRPLGTPHAVLAEQQAFVHARTALLRRTGTSGQRLVVALHLVLTQHAPRTTASDDARIHLTCTECRPGARGAAQQYPCPTAAQAYYALDATLA